MSVVFDGAAPLVSLDAILAFEGQAPGPLPISATVWIKIPAGQVPASGQHWTAWWLGRNDTFLALEVEESSGAPRVRGRMKKNSGQELAVSAAAALAAGVWHCVSVVVTQLQSGHEVRLYVDDLAGASASDSTGAVDPSAWTQFTLGSTQAAGETRRNGRFTLEHMAIWNATLADASGPDASDNARMYLERIPPKDAEARALGVGIAPNFAYWYVVGHLRNGLRVEGNQSNPILGEYANAAPPASTPSGAVDRPPLRQGFGAIVPLWSADTPAMLYASDQPIDVLPRRTIHAPSRLQPHFWVFNGPNEMVSDADPRRRLAYFDDPNMSLMANCDYDNANEVLPPYGPGLVPDVYVPRTDLAMVAKRCADYYALQDLTAGKGVGPDRRYAGTVSMRAIGEGTRDNAAAVRAGGRVLGYVGPTPDGQYTGVGRGFPLELHPADWVFVPNTPQVWAYWACWYREKGVELNALYMERWWTALKQELDDRGLCYPLRAHFDYEGWVRDTTQLDFDNPATPGIGDPVLQLGTWPLIEDDARAATHTGEVLLEEYMNGTATPRRLDDLAAPDYDDEKNFYSFPENEPFAAWWWSYQYPIRSQAVADGLFQDMATVFPSTLWSNYEVFVADNPDYKHLDNQPNRAWNSAPKAIVRGDFSSMEAYSGSTLARLRGALGGRLGYTLTEAQRDWHNSEVEASASSFEAKPVVPWFENVLRSVFDGNSPIYTVTAEDMRVQYEHHWRRGGNEFILFNFSTRPDDPEELRIVLYEPVEATIAVAQWLRDYVHSVPQNAQDRTGRLSRVARRSL